MTLAVRKTNRLKGYDYNAGGSYFVTICVKNRHAVLSKIVGDGDLDVPRNILSEYGIIVEKYILSMRSNEADVFIDKYVIMPDHVHFIVSISKDTPSMEKLDGTSRSPSPTNTIIPKMISAFKRFTNKEIGFDIWQRSYYDHIIRNEEDYWNIYKYIQENPIQWLNR